MSLLQKAVGREDGTLTLWQNKKHHTDHRIYTENFGFLNDIQKEDLYDVPVISIDSFVENNDSIPKISFIKIDVQGFELPVCLGMKKTILSNSDLVLVLEYCPQQITELGFDPKNLFIFFETMNMKWGMLNRNGSITFESVETLNKITGKSGYIDIIASQKMEELSLKSD